MEASLNFSCKYVAGACLLTAGRKGKEGRYRSGLIWALFFGSSERNKIKILLRSLFVGS